MGRVFNFDEISLNIEDLIDSGEEISFYADSSDMLPLFRKKDDIVTVSKIRSELKKDDVVLYRDENGIISLSRIMYVNANSFVLCSDNDTGYKYNVNKEKILGALVSFDRNGKTHKITDNDYKLYVFLLPATKAIRKNSKKLIDSATGFVEFLKKK